MAKLEILVSIISSLVIYLYQDHLKANGKANGGRFIHLLLITVLFYIDLSNYYTLHFSPLLFIF